MNLAGIGKRALLHALAAGERLAASSRSSLPLSNISNFLLLQHATALGTAIHATPLIPALRAAIPSCRIVVVASGFGVDVFRNNPGVHQLIETPSPLKDLRGAVRILRSQHPFRGSNYATLAPIGNERTKVLAQSMLSGFSQRVGFTVVPQLYRAPLAFDDTRSQIANNLSILQALGHPPRLFEPQIFFAEDDKIKAQEILAAQGVRPDQPVVIFTTQTSITQRKSWRAERFRAAADSLVQRYGAHIVFIGTAAESAAIDQLRDGLSYPTTSVAGKTTLPLLAALMSLATVGLTLDTGPMHIARAVGLPMVIIAPAWSPPIEWLPLGDPRFRILKNADMPAATADYIIDEVSIDEVNLGLADLLDRYPRRSSQQAP